MSRSRILTIGVDKVTLLEATTRCLEWTNGEKPRLVVTPNAEIAYAASKDRGLSQLINGADLVVPDGAGIVLAGKILGDPVPGKVAGVDLASNLLAELNVRSKGRVYLLGTRPEVVAEAARRIAERYRGLTVAGFHHGFFSEHEEPAIVKEIQCARVDFLFVGLGSPRQEQWLAAHLSELQAKVSMGVGGTLDVWAGAVARAPKWVVKLNLEWLWRIVKLGRFGRSLPPLVKFVFRVLLQRLTGRPAAAG